MNPRARRIIIPLVVLGLAVGVVLSVVFSPPRTTPATGSAAQSNDAESDQTPTDSAQSAVASDQSQDASRSEPDSGDDPDTDIGEQQTTEASAAPAESPATLRAVAPTPGGAAPEAGVEAQALGSLDPTVAKLYIELTPVGAGISNITLSEHWQTAADTRRAEAHYKAVKAGDPSPPERPHDDKRYVLQTTQLYRWAAGGQLQEKEIPVLASAAIVINGRVVRLDQANSVWTETAYGRFETTIVDENGQRIVDIVRQFVYGGGYDFTILQRLTNQTNQSLDVKWIQYGPGDLRKDRAAYLDRRRARFGFLAHPSLYPDRVESKDNDLLLERIDLLKKADKAVDAGEAGNLVAKDEHLTLWPNDTSREKEYVLAWFGTVNRYFGLTVHPILDESGQGSKSLEEIVSEIRLQVSELDDQPKIVFTGLYSPVRSIGPGEETAFDLGVYAGPLQRDVLGEQQPFAALAMDGLILYQMSAFCAICTFQWLAHFLIGFLSVVHAITFDWGLSIIILVCVVRTLLHPLTKKAQINMQRFGKVMSEIKPEIDKLQKKYKDQPKKLQQEQMRLMRERGANPLQMLGCLPMFLQTPIWIALYAMLYFAFELRHEPAFWGFFQLFWGWPFLADLSSADHFFWQFNTPFNLFANVNVTGLNLLPILMGVVFYIQQKYMSPPPSASMTKEQLQQQKIMKVMMVVLFPIMLYNAPSGLTLYIFTSTLIGIIESRYVRKHISEMDLAPKKKPKPKAKRKPKDMQARAYADAIERAKAKRKPPPKHYKKR
ncbi:MAG: membrane protein insertase YidC [Planctomycetes bacterium]|nr:membrane protein insertase YidC [Planctomycetota bacterium]